jgi:hypothetical protein
MNPMHAAIRKRLGHNSQPPEAGHSGPRESAGPDHAPEHAEGGADLHGFVAGLSDQEKSKLKSILSSDQNAQKIAQGAPSSEEQGKIAEAMEGESEMHGLEASQDAGHGISEDESDEIGKSMLDSRHIRGMATEKPKNLGERAKQYIASKLKAKGKI